MKLLHGEQRIWQSQSFRAYDYEDLKVISYVYKDEITFFRFMRS